MTDPSEDALIGLNRQSTAARLLSGAIHDVNNALMVISATVEMLEARSDVPASMKESLTRLRTQSFARLRCGFLLLSSLHRLNMVVSPT